MPDSGVIVVPCYNEAERLDVDAFARFAREGHGYRFLMVNDGSSDATLEVLEELRSRDPASFEVFDLAANSGKAEAVRRGVLRALESEPRTVGFWDADLATPLTAIPQFEEILRKRAELQMVIGARVKLLGRSVRRHRLRHYLGRVFATVASTVLRLPVYDTQCGAKLFRVSEETAALFAEPFKANWVFDVELLARFIVNRSPDAAPVEQVVYELPLDQWHDVAGSKVKPRDFFKAFFELVTIYRTYRPGHRRAAVLRMPERSDDSRRRAA